LFFHFLVDLIIVRLLNEFAGRIILLAALKIRIKFLRIKSFGIINLFYLSCFGVSKKEVVRVGLIVVFLSVFDNHNTNRALFFLKNKRLVRLNLNRLRVGCNCLFMGHYADVGGKLKAKTY